MTEALGILFFNSRVSRSIATGKLLTLSGSRHGGYRLQRYGEVYSEITFESTRYEIFKGHVGFYPANARNLSFSLKVTETFDQQNSDLVSQNAGFGAQQC